jgi:aminoglycoside phosphotransferase (APT) family kinase protein
MAEATTQPDLRTVGERGARDLVRTGQILARWLGERMPGARDVSVHDLAFPQGAGMSNETILFRARWTADGRAHDEGLVVRVAPSLVTLFKDADLRRQFDLLKSLHDGGHVRVAEPLWFEADESLLGKPFYVMRRMDGRVPISFPGYNRAGFVFDATPAERAVVWRTGLEELCRIAVTPVSACRMLDQPGLGATGFEQHLAYWRDSCRWAQADASPFLLAAEEWLEKRRPRTTPDGLSWGDARIGNMMFGADFRLMGVMDWEQASLGGPLQDLGWWLYFDKIHSTWSGVPRLEGLGTRQETLDLWRELTGYDPSDVEWYEVFAGYKLAVIMTRGFSQDRQETPGGNVNNNIFTRSMAELMGVDQPKDGYLPGRRPA